MTEKQMNEIISIAKADAIQSALETRNSLTSALRVYFEDFQTLRDMDASADVQAALCDTLDGIFATLAKHDINC